MHRRDFLKKAGAGTAFGLAAFGAARTRTAYAEEGGRGMNRPNILMITCHDIGQHIGCYGVETVQTPNLDGLAATGIRFENFFSTSAVCSPGRGSLHTGRYPQSNGLMGLTHAPWWWSLNEGEKHTAAYLKELGYATFLIGFNHIDKENTRRLGYDTVLSPGCKAHETVAEARKIIEEGRRDAGPFFAKIGFTEVHRAFTHGADTEKGLFIPPWLQDTPDIRGDLAAFQAEIKFFDERVGEILAALENSRIAENTLVILTADHGIPYPGAKWSVRKAGFEVPFIVRQPGTVFSGGKVYSDIMSNVDVLPTILDYVGAPVPDCIQGVSYLDCIRGNASAPRTAAFSQYTPDMKRDNLSRSVITGRYHLIRYFDQGRAVDYPVDVHPQRFAQHVERCRTKGTRPFVQLYDLRADPYELNDIGSDPANARIVSDLSQRLLNWLREVNDPILKGLPPTPYYRRAIEDLMGTVAGNK